MTYRGRIHDGGVILDQAVPLPEGSPVKCVVVPLDLRELSAKEASPFDDLMEFAGTVKGTPKDGSRRHDAYVTESNNE